jgi:hypothetical protein
VTRWTDAQAEDLLRETFVAHEGLADPATARKIVPSRRRRRVLPILAAAAAVALIVSGTTYLTTRKHAANELAPVPAPATSTLAQNREAAGVEARRLLALATLPAGAKPLKGQPSSWVPTNLYPGGDQTLRTTAWFKIADTAEHVGTYLLAHPPAGMGNVYPRVERDAHGVRDLIYQTDDVPVSPAFGTGQLDAVWEQQGQSTTVQFTTSINARLPRTTASFITGSVRSIDVTQQVSSGGLAATKATHGTVTRLADITEFVTAANALVGNLAGDTGGTCGGSLFTYSLTIDFHTANGELRFHETSGCTPVVDVSRGGHHLNGTLDGTGLGSVGDLITRVLKSS